MELTKNLLRQEDYEYVFLGKFSTDMIEKAFGNLRQGSGGSYFINAQQVPEKLRIKQAKLQVSLNCDYTSQLKLLNTNVVIVNMFWTPMLQLILSHFLILKALSVKKKNKSRTFQYILQENWMWKAKIMMILIVIMGSLAATWLHWIEVAWMFLKTQLVNGQFFAI